MRQQKPEGEQGGTSQPKPETAGGQPKPSMFDQKVDAQFDPGKIIIKTEKPQGE